MDPIRSFCGKLRALAVTLDSEMARLQRALDGEDSDFESYPMRILHDLHSEVWTLKDDVSTLLDKASSESKETIIFIKATKVLMKKNSVDIMKIREFFQKYGYNPRAKKNSVGECEGVDAAPDSTGREALQPPNVEGDVCDAAVPPASEKPPCSPQLADFGLERYLIPQVPPYPPQAETNRKEEPTAATTPFPRSLVQAPKTPRRALNMDDCECVTPKLEHVGISEYTVCLNDDYTVGLKNMKNKRAEAGEGEPESTGTGSAAPGLVHQQVGQYDAEYTKSPLAPTFCTPGLKIPSTRNSTALVSTNYSVSKTDSSSSDLEMKDCVPLVLNSDKCFENFMAPSSPVISSHENLLRTPTPPRVTSIPEDILQILSKYNRNLAAPVAVKAVPPGDMVLPGGRCILDGAAAEPAGPVCRLRGASGRNSSGPSVQNGN